MIPWSVFGFLLVAHFLCDFPLQGDFLARGKNHRDPIPGVPWLWCLVAHSAIHAGAVALVTGYWTIGLVEFFLHLAIDWHKCNGETDFGIDQWAHVAAKFVEFAAFCFLSTLP